MIASEIRLLYKTEDFKSFTIVLRGGKFMRVDNPDYIWVTPKGTVHLFESDVHNMFSLDRIEYVQYVER